MSKNDRIELIRSSLDDYFNSTNSVNHKHFLLMRKLIAWVLWKSHIIDSLPLLLYTKDDWGEYYESEAGDLAYERQRELADMYPQEEHNQNYWDD